MKVEIIISITLKKKKEISVKIIMQSNYEIPVALLYLHHSSLSRWYFSNKFSCYQSIYTELISYYYYVL
jgi:hypothetical protein